MQYQRRICYHSQLELYNVKDVEEDAIMVESCPRESSIATIESWKEEGLPSNCLALPSLSSLGPSLVLSSLNKHSIGFTDTFNSWHYYHHYETH